jgi:triosephosphate isomerase (TIM)
MNRTPLIAGNWKMHKTAQEAEAFIAALIQNIPPQGRKVCLAVPFTAIDAVIKAVSKSALCVGAQNMHDQKEGAFTGEISAQMLRSSGASFVLLGHSERRQLFEESNSFIHRKLLSALNAGLTPFLCVGELLAHRENGEEKEVLQTQLEECLQGISSEQAEQIVIAYEPIWAIGTGKTATPEMAQAAHHCIRKWLEKRFGKACAEKISLLYGGSVKPDNTALLMQQADIDGVLVGGASLDAHTFAQIVNY